MTAPIVDDLSDLFPHTVMVTPGTRTGDGTFVPSGPAVGRRARVSGRIRRVTSVLDGQERVSSVECIFAGAFDLTADLHKYLLPAEFVPREPLPIAVEKTPDENGPHHETVYFA
jgi:uncharacterized protein YfcZ (UPF0381/DUF406 family)